MSGAKDSYQNRYVQDLPWDGIPINSLIWLPAVWYPGEKIWIVSRRVGHYKRVQGVKDSSEIVNNYRELKVWQRSYQLCWEVYWIIKGYSKH